LRINLAAATYSQDLLIGCGMAIYGKGAAKTILSGKVQTTPTNGINTLLFAGLKFTYTGNGHRFEV